MTPSVGFQVRFELCLSHIWLWDWQHSWCTGVLLDWVRRQMWCCPRLMTAWLQLLVTDGPLMTYEWMELSVSLSTKVNAQTCAVNLHVPSTKHYCYTIYFNFLKLTSCFCIFRALLQYATYASRISYNWGCRVCWHSCNLHIINSLTDVCRHLKDIFLWFFIFGTSLIFCWKLKTFQD